ncbi:MAG: Ig-like domain-containing protein, partial [Lachnospiraceae bacterium]|nr:Ig-like domain-containing protein [Lachnospiraceae bacterium]
SVSWSSSNDSVATVSGGTVTAKAAGKATITATVKGPDSVTIKNPTLSCSVEVTAQNNQVEAKLNTSELRLVKNQKEYLKVVDGSGKTYDSKTYVTWESSDKSIVEVHSDGQLKALKDGKATIKAKLKSGNGVTFKNTELTCQVIVGEKNYTKLTISGKREVEVGIGQKLTLTAKSEPEGAELIWKCTDETIAKVDKNGVVTGVKEGKTKIKVACKENDKIADEIKITVKKTVVDPAAKLKDKNGNQLYYKKDGKYKEATYQDFLEHTHFYKLKASAYRYTGWQTIDGYLYYFDKNGNYVTGDQVIQGAKYTFGSDGKMSKSSGTMGIDVSKHNGNIDWNAVKNSGVSYVIIRCGYRGYSTGVLVEDPKFRSNIQGAKAAGLKVGAYFFSQAVNEVEAVEEASMAIDLVKGYGLNYPLFLDVEGSGGRADGISRDTRTAVCKTFCQTVQNSGIQAGIYANKTWFTEKISTGSLTNYKLWLAQYASTPTYTATRYDLWQYSSKGRVSGISGNVDMNISYVNY